MRVNLLIFVGIFALISIEFAASDLIQHCEKVADHYNQCMTGMERCANMIRRINRFICQTAIRNYHRKCSSTIRAINEGLDGKNRDHRAALTKVRRMSQQKSTASHPIFSEDQLDKAMENMKQIGIALAQHLGQSAPVDADTGGSFLFSGDMVLSDQQVNQMLENMKNLDSNMLPVLPFSSSSDPSESVMSSNLPIDSDIPSSLRVKRQVILKNAPEMWPTSSVINYMFDAELDADSEATSEIRKAFDFWSSRTCLKFEENIGDEYIFIANGPGCFSHVGRDTSSNDPPRVTKVSLNIMECMDFGLITHELAHAIGLYHEHLRPDRDNFVKVQLDNVQTSPQLQSANFLPCADKSQCQTQGIPYDFGSNLHFGPTMFQKAKGLSTLIPQNNLYVSTIGQRRSGPTFYDVKQINNLYCPTSSCNKGLTCQNNGYPHPTKCGTCLCPDGYSGSTCASIDTGSPKSCGGTITAIDSFQTLQSPNFDNGVAKMDKSQRCTWLLQAPTGKKLELKFTGKFGFPHESYDGMEAPFCDWNHVEIRLNNDLANSGLRFCGDNTPSASLKSQSNLALVLLRAPYDADDQQQAVGFQLQYRAV